MDAAGEIQPRHQKIPVDAMVQPPQGITDSTGEPQIPDEVLRHIAAPVSVSQPVQGRCSTVLFLHACDRDYALKLAKGQYRSAELEAEYAALLYYRQLAHPLVPVAEPCLFVRHAEDACLLASRCDGQPLNQVLQTAIPQERAEIIRCMARTLASIHGSPDVHQQDWSTCLREQLRFAEHHMCNGSLDPTEFVHEGQPIEPAVLLGRLCDQMPRPGVVRVVHGDYRPKNLLWDGKARRISAVLDWAFCDIGDPYYDLAIVLYYVRTEAERSLFLGSYGMPLIDEQRLRYFDNLSKFLNV